MSDPVASITIENLTRQNSSEVMTADGHSIHKVEKRRRSDMYNADIIEMDQTVDAHSPSKFSHDLMQVLIAE